MRNQTRERKHKALDYLIFIEVVVLATLLLRLLQLNGGVVALPPLPVAHAAPQSPAVNVQFQTGTGDGIPDKTCITNPSQCSSIDAITVNVMWSSTQPSAPPAAYNWSAIDGDITSAINAGYKIVPLLRYINENGGPTNCSSGQWMPSWEISKLGTANSKCDSDEGEYIPNYANAGFVADLNTWVHAFANHVRTNGWGSHVAYVRVGYGVAGEEFPNKTGTSDGTIWNWLTSKGANQAGFQTFVHNAFTTWGSAGYVDFAPLTLQYNVQWYNPGSNCIAGTTAVNDEEVCYALSHLPTTGQVAGFNPTNLSPKFTYSDVAAVEHYLNTITPTLAHRGYQTDASVSKLPCSQLGSNICAYYQTAYCYAHGQLSKNNITVEWYNGVAETLALQPDLATFRSYVNGSVTPPGGDASYCSGQPGW